MGFALIAWKRPHEYMRVRSPSSPQPLYPLREDDEAVQANAIIDHNYAPTLPLVHALIGNTANTTQGHPMKHAVFPYTSIEAPHNLFYLDLSACVQRLSALIILLLTLPILLFISFFIKAEDGGPVLFRQRRVGYLGQVFTIIKLRTMRDGETTKTGRWLRQCGVDELPQLWNIIRGDMLFIGPRPLLASDIRRLKWDSQYHQIRWHTKPGITGLAQIYGGRGKRMSWFLDLYYVRHQSIQLDLQILTLSVLMAVIGKRIVKQTILKPFRANYARSA